MHSEILNARQTQLLPLLAQFRREYYLVGGFFRLPSLLQLAAMKAYALGRRSKWKDYVDLYFLLRDHFKIADISTAANQLFGELYSEKMFRTQLCYFHDIDYTEAVDYLIPNPPTDEEIKQLLTEIAMQGV